MNGSKSQNVDVWRKYVEQQANMVNIVFGFCVPIYCESFFLVDVVAQFQFLF